MNLEKDGKRVMSEPHEDVVLIKAIDSLMDMMDVNKDGYITYIEYRKSRSQL